MTLCHLAALKKTAKETSEAYEQDLQECLMRRQALQEQFEELEKAQDLGLNKLKQLRTSVQAVAVEGRWVAAKKLAGEAVPSSKLSGGEVQAGERPVAAGTTVRATLDTEQAGIHTDDNIKVLHPSDERRTVNKSNTTKNEQLKKLAEEIGKSAI